MEADKPHCMEEETMSELTKAIESLKHRDELDVAMSCFNAAINQCLEIIRQHEASQQGVDEAAMTVAYETVQDHIAFGLFRQCIRAYAVALRQQPAAQVDSILLESIWKTEGKPVSFERLKFMLEQYQAALQQKEG